MLSYGANAVQPDREAQVKAVIELIEAGNSERSACEQVGINRGTFRSAALRFEAADHYARGLTALAHEQIERIEQIEDDLISGKVDVQTARLVSDNRKWLASKFLPKKYGERVDLNHGGQPENPLSVTVIERRIVNKPQPDNGTEE